MDCPSPVYSLQPGQSPVDQGTRQHQQHQHQQSPYMAKRLGTSPSVSPDTFGDDFFFCDPCPSSSVENWTESSPDSVLSNWGLGSSYESTLSPLFSPQKVPLSGSLFDADHHQYRLPQDTADVSCSTTTTTGPATDSVKIEQHSPLETSIDPFFDWTYDGDFNLSYNFETYYPPSSSSEIPVSPPPQYETLAPTKTETKSTVIPPLSPPVFSNPSPITTVKAEPQPDRADSRSSSSVSAPQDTSDLPYSKLIYLALLSAIDRKLPLQGIYRWFEQNTNKGKEGSKGWQNSIRHNLSMNAVCLSPPLFRKKNTNLTKPPQSFMPSREESPNGKRAVNYWRLTEDAIKRGGIHPTTRYRKQANQRKGLGSEAPTPQRQRSGARGGKATKITARNRGHANADELSPASAAARYHSAAATAAAQRQRQRQRQRQYYQQQAQQQQRPILPQLKLEQAQEQHQHGLQQRHQQQQQQPPNELYYYQRYTPCPTTALPGYSEPAPAASIDGFDLSNLVGRADPPRDIPVTSDMGGSESLPLELGVLCGMSYSTYDSPNRFFQDEQLPNGLPGGGWTS